MSENTTVETTEAQDQEITGIDFEEAERFFQTPPTELSEERVESLSAILGFKFGKSIGPLNILTWEEMGSLVAEAARVGYEYALRNLDQRGEEATDEAAEAGTE